ncbi:MAG TPA: SRPBCC family protein [Nocardioidaceae bacterium]|nr:SRPBCC family protein [Nocardioidaceae bacterium]
MTTKVEKSITVDVPISTAYNQWTQFEDFPQFMGGVQQVEQLSDQRLHWVAEIAGVKREWYATVLEQRPDEKVAWAATEGATNAGAVYFAPSGTGQTLVRLELEYEPEGLVEKVGDALNIVGKQAESDLERFKKFIEGRRDATGAWRGDVEGFAVGTPGVEATTSQGDSGKAGISGKAAAAGVAAAAAVGVAAAAAARSGSDDTETVPDTGDVSAVPAPDVSRPSAGLDEAAAYPVAGDVEPDVVVVVDDVESDRTVGGSQADPLTDDVQLDSDLPGATDRNDGSPRTGV